MITRELPTEPGYYLFIGARDPKEVASQFWHKPRVELVRVGRNGAGQLMYIGADFFYSPQKAVGAWMPLDISALEAEGTDALREPYVRTVVQELQERPYLGCTPESMRAFLTSAWGRIPIQDPEVVEDLVQRAIAMNLLDGGSEPDSEE
jgi:hypothetical protein